jgi:hypothetical protein
VRTHFDHVIRPRNQRLADLRKKTADLERRLSDVRLTLDRELAHPAGDAQAWTVPIRQVPERSPAGVSDEPGAGGFPLPHPAAGPGDAPGSLDGLPPAPDGRTAGLVSHGRPSAGHRGPSRGLVIVAGAGVAAVLAAIVAMIAPSGGSSWPASVATVQREIAQACQNPDVRSEPGQVNFACAKASRQILWIFALLTSGNNPRFADLKTGRVGLEPINPAQGGELASSLNLHHPYNPSSPTDSLEVAARAINNIIGGATVTGLGGSPVVEPGLESSPANCARYTGSAAVTKRAGFPPLCAKPVTSPARQAALVADIYQRWVVGTGPGPARAAAVLFENARNPGDPRVQEILRQLPGSTLSP